MQFELFPLASNILKLSTPYDFVELLLAQQFRKVVNAMIDLSLTTVEVSGMSAEEIFVGSCLYAGEMHPQAPLGDSVSLNFEAAQVNGTQVKDLLKEIVENIDEE
jgi:hypothetical protein